MEIKLTVDMTPRLEQVLLNLVEVIRPTHRFEEPCCVKKEQQEQIEEPTPTRVEVEEPTRVEVVEERSWPDVVQERMQHRLQEIIGIGKDLNALTGADADIKNKVLKEFIGIARKLEKGKKPTQLSEISRERFLMEVTSVGVNGRGEITRAPLFDVTTETFVE